MSSKWSGAYWADLGERVVSTFLGAVLTMLTLDGATSVDWSDGQAVWIVLGAPTVISLVKGLLANMAKTDTMGASAIAGLPFRTEHGVVTAKTILIVVSIIAVVLFILWLVGAPVRVG